MALSKKSKENNSFVANGSSQRIFVLAHKAARLENLQSKQGPRDTTALDRVRSSTQDETLKKIFSSFGIEIALQSRSIDELLRFGFSAVSPNQRLGMGGDILVSILTENYTLIAVNHRIQSGRSLIVTPHLGIVDAKKGKYWVSEDGENFKKSSDDVIVQSYGIYEDLYPIRRAVERRNVCQPCSEGYMNAATYEPIPNESSYTPPRLG